MVYKEPTVSRLGRLTETFKYPSNHGMIRGIIFRDIPALLTTGGVLTFSKFAVESAMLTGALDKGVAQPLSDIITYSAYFALTGALGSTTVGGVLGYKEIQNRILYGKLLTVGKVTTQEDTFFREYIPELTSQKYYGELHIEGKTWISNPFAPKPSTLQVVREGLTGLKLLAQASRDNDPRLDDIEIFAGSSSFVTHRLSRFGFTVVDNPAPKSPQAKERQAKLCYITRKALIDSLPQLEARAS